MLARARMTNLLARVHFAVQHFATNRSTCQTLLLRTRNFFRNQLPAEKNGERTHQKRRRNEIDRTHQKRRRNKLIGLTIGKLSQFASGKHKGPRDKQSDRHGHTPSFCRILLRNSNLIVQRLDEIRQESRIQSIHLQSHSDSFSSLFRKNKAPRSFASN